MPEAHCGWRASDLSVYLRHVKVSPFLLSLRLACFLSDSLHKSTSANFQNVTENSLNILSLKYTHADLSLLAAKSA